jgi:hypothetical protein
MSAWAKEKPGPASEAASGPAPQNPAADQEPETEKENDAVQQPTIATVDRQRLIAALDTLADVAIAIENNADQRVPLDNDQLITALREIIADLAFEIEASDLLA